MQLHMVWARLINECIQKKRKKKKWKKKKTTIRERVSDALHRNRLCKPHSELLIRINFSSFCFHRIKGLNAVIEKIEKKMEKLKQKTHSYPLGLTLTISHIKIERKNFLNFPLVFFLYLFFLHLQRRHLNENALKTRERWWNGKIRRQREMFWKGDIWKTH